MDWATRKVQSGRLSNTMPADFCVEALNEAIARFGPPEIMNTDQGSQFTGSAWITTLTAAGIRISMGGRGRCMLSCKWTLPLGINIWAPSTITIPRHSMFHTVPPPLSPQATQS